MALQMKLDLLKMHRAEYATPSTPTLIDIEPARYLTIEGEGAPASEAFQDAMGALFGVAYTIKFARKALGQDFKFGAVEGLWSTPSGGSDWSAITPDQWRWKLLVRFPDFVDERDIADAIAALRARQKEGPFERVRLETIAEGPSIQMLHVGSYASEGETVAQMEAFAAAHGLEFYGPHHEIYLSDPRRVPPERLRTILRHPVHARAREPVAV